MIMSSIHHLKSPFHNLDYAQFRKKEKLTHSEIISKYWLHKKSTTDQDITKEIDTIAYNLR